MINKKSVTIKDIAQAAEVSPALVSFVMKNVASGTRKYKVSEATTQRVLEVAAKYDYHPSAVARTLRSGKTYTIGVLLSDISNPFFAELARCLENKAFSLGYSVIFSSTDEKNDKMNNLVSVYIEKGVDGLVAVPNDGSAEALNTFVKTGKPLVLVDRDIDGENFDCVSLNNAYTARKLTEALLAQGCKKTEMISYTFRASNMVAREQGYLDAMKAAGLEKACHIERYHHNSFDGLQDYVTDAHKRGVDSFLLASNTLAKQTIFGILQSGLSVPGDFRIATFDSNGFLEMPGLKLIAAAQPIAEFADKAIELIVNKIEHPAEQSQRAVKFLFEPQLKLI